MRAEERPHSDKKERAVVIARRYSISYSLKPDDPDNPEPGKWHNEYIGVLIDDTNNKIPGALSLLLQLSAGKDDQGNYLNDDVDFIQFKSGKKLVLGDKFVKALPHKPKGSKGTQRQAPSQPTFDPGDFGD